ncbi:type II secretion system major pseudopilin GspG [Sphingomonas sp. CJ99]
MHIVLKQFHDSVAKLRKARKSNPLPAAGETGLTLVEMIVVLAIIALVAALIVPNVIGRPDQARVTTTQTNLTSVSGALKLYRLDNGQYPTTAQGLKALVERPTVPPLANNWPDGGYLSAPAVDAWQNPLVYESDGRSYEVKSLGADGQPGGEGMDADISSGKRN